LFSEDDFLLSEVLFSPFTLTQLEKISQKLEYLREIIDKKDEHEMRKFINDLRRNIR
jgi:prephenate dehydrogenase